MVFEFRPHHVIPEGGLRLRLPFSLFFGNSVPLTNSLDRLRFGPVTSLNPPLLYPSSPTPSLFGVGRGPEPWSVLPPLGPLKRLSLHWVIFAQNVSN